MKVMRIAFSGWITCLSLCILCESLCCLTFQNLMVLLSVAFTDWESFLGVSLGVWSILAVILGSINACHGIANGCLAVCCNLSWVIFFTSFLIYFILSFHTWIFMLQYWYSLVHGAIELRKCIHFGFSDEDCIIASVTNVSKAQLIVMIVLGSIGLVVWIIVEVVSKCTSFAYLCSMLIPLLGLKESNYRNAASNDDGAKNRLLSHNNNNNNNDDDSDQSDTNV